MDPLAPTRPAAGELDDADRRRPRPGPGAAVRVGGPRAVSPPAIGHDVAARGSESEAVAFEARPPDAVIAGAPLHGWGCAGAR